MRMSALFSFAGFRIFFCSGFCSKKRLHTARFSAKLILSEKVESVMLMHVRHFATISIGLYF